MIDTRSTLERKKKPEYDSYVCLLREWHPKPENPNSRKMTAIYCFYIYYYTSNVNIKGSRHVSSNGQCIKYYLRMIQYTVNDDL